MAFLICCMATASFGLSAANAASPDYADYAKALSHVDDRGLVQYEQLKANRKPLDDFTAWLATVSEADYESWDEPARIAFWINAYNALTLKSIIDHYPIRSSFFSSLLYPKNSIRQIDGVWTEVKHPVMGRQMTLDEIEHQVLRKQFDEPRVHMALVCAALSCPPLRAEPYLGEKLDAQLEDQSRRFLRREANFRAVRSRSGKGTVYLSSIFDWFGQDFVGKYGTDTEFKDRDAATRAVLSFVSLHVPEADREYLKTGAYTISHTDYDWTLNERK